MVPHLHKLNFQQFFNMALSLAGLKIVILLSGFLIKLIYPSFMSINSQEPTSMNGTVCTHCIQVMFTGLKHQAFLKGYPSPDCSSMNVHKHGASSKVKPTDPANPFAKPSTRKYIMEHSLQSSFSSSVENQEVLFTGQIVILLSSIQLCSFESNSLINIL